MKIDTSLYYSSNHLSKFRKKHTGIDEYSSVQTAGGHIGKIKNAALYENKTGVCPENKSVNIRNKATAGENPSGRLSFKANPNSFAMKLAKSNAFNWTLDVTQKNSLVADALFALFLTSVLRPMMLFFMPTKGEDKNNDKRKNEYQVGHSVATGLMGLGTTVAVAVPVKKGVNKFINHVKSNPELKNKFAYIFATPKTETMFKEAAGRIHQPIFLPLRAMATIAIVPPLLNMLGLKKRGPVKAPDGNPMFNDYAGLNFKGSETFKDVAGILNHKKTNNNDKKNIPSFKGTPTDLIAKGIGAAAGTGFFQKLVEFLAACKNGFPHLIAAESLLLSGFYMHETAKSKKIEQDQKPAMIINQGIVAVACTIGAYTIDGVINKAISKFKNIYKEAFKEMKAAKHAELLQEMKYAFSKAEKVSFAEKRKFVENFIKAGTANRVLSPGQLAKRLDGISFLKSTVIFASIYRFIGPVVLTPVANWISNKFQADKK